ncbi:hypothetical protein BKA58DRAFT_391057 [Alternaria rosae]|uniref:uncharacterized protein n=1 Tax=Alternaria rosae TaxID=1187941 RepID=UPI001E8E0457|nr:uncharacterized protein BKA58DRAFT_391057 [Alternaria rosae]KAH6864913.1 hypothetical protein BKA58DRAFT_391057 [Alternaria rosae]
MMLVLAILLYGTVVSCFFCLLKDFNVSPVSINSLIPHLETSGVGIMHSPIRPSTTQTMPLQNLTATPLDPSRNCLLRGRPYCWSVLGSCCLLALKRHS